MNRLSIQIPRIILRNARNVSSIELQEKYSEKNPYDKNNNNYNEYYNSKQFKHKVNIKDNNNKSKYNPNILKNISIRDIPLL